MPLRIAVGPRDMEAGKVESYRRDTHEKQSVVIEDLAQFVLDQLHAIQGQIFDTHKTFTLSRTTKVDTYEEFKQKIEA